MAATAHSSFAMAEHALPRGPLPAPQRMPSATASCWEELETHCHLMDRANVKITDIDLTKLIVNDDDHDVCDSAPSKCIVYGLTSPAATKGSKSSESQMNRIGSAVVLNSEAVAAPDTPAVVSRSHSAGRRLSGQLEPLPDETDGGQFSFSALPSAMLLHSQSAPPNMKQVAALTVADDDVMTYFSAIEARNDKSQDALEASIRGEQTVRSAEGIPTRRPPFLVQSSGNLMPSSAPKGRLSGPIVSSDRMAGSPASFDGRPPRPAIREGTSVRQLSTTVHGANQVLLSGPPSKDFTVIAEDADMEGWQPVSAESKKSFFKRLGR